MALHKNRTAAAELDALHHHVTSIVTLIGAGSVGPTDLSELLTVVARRIDNVRIELGEL